MFKITTVFLIFISSSLANANQQIKIDKTEVSVAAFAEFIDATGLVTKAEKQGGMVYQNGWVTKPDWNWKKPFGVLAEPNEPAVHITFLEAENYCRWRGQRLPTRQEWIKFGYTENRTVPADGFVSGKTYPYPTGKTPLGANCLNDCGAESVLHKKQRDYKYVLNRGYGHIFVGESAPGVNGLYDMGANVWEWARIENTKGEQATMGGSWWYGKRQMMADYAATKPHDMAAVYIGFRCFREGEGIAMFPMQ